MNRPKTKILVDGGDPAETLRIKQLLGFVDGQTTNPTLISKNPHIKQLLDSGHKLSEREELDEYKKIVKEISPLVGDAGVSIEVFADRTTTAEAMVNQAREMFSWIPNAYIKFPCTTEGLKAAETAVQSGIRVNMTLCFSQQQVAAVYAATKGTKVPVYVSPFVGRLDDLVKTVWTSSRMRGACSPVATATFLSWPPVSAASTSFSIAFFFKPSWSPRQLKFCRNGPKRNSLCPPTVSFTNPLANPSLIRKSAWTSHGRATICVTN